MDYYIKELKNYEHDHNNAGTKARDDVETILDEIKIKRIEIPINSRKKTGFSKLKEYLFMCNLWKKQLSGLQSGDRIFIQYPFTSCIALLLGYLKTLRKRNIKLIFIIHDLLLLRELKLSNNRWIRNFVCSMAEKQMVFGAEKLIVHNKHMAEWLCNIGADREKLISLDIFDYLIPQYEIQKFERKNNNKKSPIIIAGMLAANKVPYITHLPDNCNFYLYGPNFKGNTNEKIKYFGSFHQDEIPYVIDGSFGLIWDGESSETCSGVFGEYLKINNPHKTSLYLASDIPVIIWSEAALADFVLENQCGIVVASLYDIAGRLEMMTEDEYQVLKLNAMKVGKKLRSGFYLKKAIEKTKN